MKDIVTIIASVEEDDMNISLQIEETLSPFAKMTYLEIIKQTIVSQQKSIQAKKDKEEANKLILFDREKAEAHHVSDSLPDHLHPYTLKDLPY